jgi:NADPH-dependent glutamate synthase beta subunit-like oxidoreductase
VSDDLLTVALKEIEAVLYATGATNPRNLPVDGRQLTGIHYAMQFLEANQKVQAGAPADAASDKFVATGKNVIVIGGGDTATDCIGTSLRQVRGVECVISQIHNIFEAMQDRDRV